MKRRKFLAHAAAVTVGAAVLGTDSGSWVSNPTQTPAPGRIGMTDVRQVEAATRALRALDYQYGGGSCRDAVVAQLSWGQQMLGASATRHWSRSGSSSRWPTCTTWPAGRRSTPA